MKVTILFYLLAFAAIASACVCPAGQFQFKLDVYTDVYPSEISWRLIRNSNGAQIFSNPSLANFTLYSELVCLDNGSYTFEIDDSYGDGICCGYYGDGYYEGYVYGSQIFSGGDFALTDNRTFSGTSTCAPSSASPTSHITPWLVGPTTYTLNGGNNYFDGFLGCSNVIGSKVTQNVVVQLFDFNCINEKDNMNSTNAVTIFQVNPSPGSFGYSVNISQSNIGDDTGGFVFPTGPSTGDVKFCTRVSTWEGSIEVAFRETNFVLSYNLTDNTFALVNIDIQENDPDSFITAVNTDFSVAVYQCYNYLQTTPHTLEQDENLVICLAPQHPGNMAHVVHISNFDVKLYAGSTTTGDYVEYNPVWFGTGGWRSDSLTAVNEQPNSADIIMISTPVIAQFFIQGHTQISVSGNCFLEFDSTKEVRAPVFVGYDMQFGVIDIKEEGCLVGLLRRIRGLF